jgi:hypothetical protein
MVVDGAAKSHGRVGVGGMSAARLRRARSATLQIGEHLDLSCGTFHSHRKMAYQGTGTSTKGPLGAHRECAEDDASRRHRGDPSAIPTSWRSKPNFIASTEALHELAIENTLSVELKDK